MLQEAYFSEILFNLESLIEDTDSMKALSIKQPYAELILQGRKVIELRRWNTQFRGPFLIHSPGAVDQEAMKKYGFTTLPTGGIVGQATLLGVKKYLSSEEHQKDQPKHLASEVWGKYGFMLGNQKRLLFKPCKGALNFWNYPNP